MGQRGSDVAGEAESVNDSKLSNKNYTLMSYAQKNQPLENNSEIYIYKL